MKPKVIITLLFFVFYGNLFAKKLFLLVRCQPPFSDTIWNYDNWLHKKDTSFILPFHKFDSCHFFEYQYKSHTESHLIVCYHIVNYIDKMALESKIGGIYYTAQMVLRGNKLLKHGYLTWHSVRIPVLEQYWFNELKEIRRYFKPTKNSYSKTYGLRLATIMHLDFLNRINIQTFDSIGNCVRIVAIKNNQILSSSDRINRRTKENDLIFIGQFKSDTVDNLKSILSKRDTVIILQCDTWKNSQYINFKSVEKKGRLLIIKHAFYSKFMDSIHCLNNSFTVFKSIGKNRYKWTQIIDLDPIVKGVGLTTSNYRLYKFGKYKDRPIYFCELRKQWFRRFKEIMYDENMQIMRVSRIKNKFYVKHNYTNEGLKQISFFDTIFEDNFPEIHSELQ